MLSINLYEIILSKYLDFKKYIDEHMDKEDEFGFYDTISNLFINKDEFTKYNIYKSLMDILKNKYELSNLNDEEFVNEMVQRYGKSKSIFDEEVDIDTFTNGYANYIEYDEDILNDIDNYIEESYILDDYSLDYLKIPEFVNKLLEMGRGFEHTTSDYYGDLDIDDIFYDVLEYVSDETRNNKDYFKNIKDVKFPNLLGMDLRKDEDFIFENIIYRFPYQLISDELKHNRNFILKLLNYDTNCFQYFDEKFKDDKEIVLKVIENSGKAKYLNDNPPDLESMPINSIIVVVRRGIMECVSERLKNDPEIIEKALNYDVYEYEFLPKKYKNDKKLIEKVLNIKNDVAQYLEDDIRNDTKYMEKLYLKYDFPIVYTNKEIINKYANDKNIMKKEIYKNIDAINYLSDELFNDKEYIIDVIQNASSNKWFYNDRLIKAYKNDEDVMLALVKHDNYFIKYVGKRLQKKLIKMLDIKKEVYLDEEEYV